MSSTLWGAEATHNAITGYRMDVTLNSSPPGSIFWISSEGIMPVIEAKCVVSGDAVPERLTYSWLVTLVMDPSDVPYASGRTTAISPISKTNWSSRLNIPFDATHPRGGNLTVTASTMINGLAITATQTAQIRGTNPTLMRISSELGQFDNDTKEVFLKLLATESALCQFLSSNVTIKKHTTYKAKGFPHFSHDGFGGVGLGQLTLPRPTDEQVWNWKENLKGAIQLFKEKNGTARSYLEKYPQSREFKALAAAYNKSRADNRLPPVNITLPSYTTLPDSSAMALNESIRLYNGEPGKNFGTNAKPDRFLSHEYVALAAYQNPLVVTAAGVNGALVVDVNTDGKSGTARWHQRTKEDRENLYTALGIGRSHWGDTNYVNDVRNIDLTKFY